MLAGNDPDAKVKLGALTRIWLFPVHFHIPCTVPKGCNAGADEPGTPPAVESLAMTLPSPVKVISSRYDEG